jgi:farnesyl-diphosphate farnesyltransferase
MSQTHYSNNQMLTSLLRDVSRSFYLTLRVLPVAVRPQIGLAYLLARTADTIADTELVPLERRFAALQSLLDRITAANNKPLDFGELARHQGSPAERVLLERCENSLEFLNALPIADGELVVDVLRTILSGQELDLRRFGQASSSNIVSLRSAAELDDYTYRVAGCVGEFWTHSCRAHLFPLADLDDAFLLLNGVRFGKGLQLINILRDLAVDLRQGRCYLPSEQLQLHGLSPQDLVQSSNEPRLRPIYNGHLDLAEAHLAAGWAYTNKLPRRAIRVRLACAWPLLIGRQTLRLLRQGPVLNPENRPKVTRGDVRMLLWRSVFFYPWPSRWEGLFEAAGKDH